MTILSFTCNLYFRKEITEADVMNNFDFLIQNNAENDIGDDDSDDIDGARDHISAAVSNFAQL